jgi:hypothetical protein
MDQARTKALFTHAATLPLGRAAVVLTQAGIPVFPCKPGGKTPLTAHGFKDATTDLAQISHWWSRAPGANIAMPTGAASGWDVVDIDVRDAGSGFTAFGAVAETGFTDGWAMAVRTPSGGMHLYYSAHRERPQRSWSSAGSHVDFRGEGGYVIVPPSRAQTPDGDVTTYRATTFNQARHAPIDAARLRTALDPEAGRREWTRQPREWNMPASERRALRGSRLAGWVAARPEGQRNAGLFWASCRMAEVGYTLADTLTVLGPAARTAGLADREIATTVASAYRTTGRATGPPAAERDGVRL